jgi:hypothetical protein
LLPTPAKADLAALACPVRARQADRTCAQEHSRDSEEALPAVLLVRAALIFISTLIVRGGLTSVFVPWAMAWVQMDRRGLDQYSTEVQQPSRTEPRRQALSLSAGDGYEI